MVYGNRISLFLSLGLTTPTDLAKISTFSLPGNRVAPPSSQAPPAAPLPRLQLPSLSVAASVSLSNSVKVGREGGGGEGEGGREEGEGGEGREGTEGWGGEGRGEEGRMEGR